MSPRAVLPFYDRVVEASKTIHDRELLELTPREREVLELLALGAANKQIALSLGMTEHTVKFHLAGIFRKLDVTNRTEAATKHLRLVAGR
jgi:DNA-binding NarL/FixJ family response regulator